MKLNSECSFTPIINKSKSPNQRELKEVKETNEIEDVGNRLYDYRLRYKENIEILKHSAELELNQQNNNIKMVNTESKIKQEKSTEKSNFNQKKVRNKNSVTFKKDLIERIEDDIIERNQKNKKSDDFQDDFLKSEILTSDDIKNYEKNLKIRNNKINNRKYNKALDLPLNKNASNKQTNNKSSNASNSENMMKINTTKNNSHISDKKPTQLNNISDTQILEMANRMVTTDHSLDEFQHKNSTKSIEMDFKNDDSFDKKEKDISNTILLKTKKEKSNKSLKEMILNNSNKNVYNIDNTDNKQGKEFSVKLNLSNEGKHSSLKNNKRTLEFYSEVAK